MSSTVDPGGPPRGVPDLVRLGMAKRMARIARGREGLADFGPLVVRDEQGSLIEYHDVHLDWIWHLTYCWNRRLNAAIWAPFGHGKSSSLVVPAACWLVGKDPQIRIKIVCAGDDMAAARVEACRMILESPEYREIFPLVRPGHKWTNHQIFVRRAGAAIDPTIHARGVDTKGIGSRADVILFDDVVDDMNSEDLVQRVKVKNRVHKKWMSRLDPARARVLWVCTPWHVDDASHELLELPNWCTLRQPIAQNLEYHQSEVVGAGPDYIEAVGRMREEHRAAMEALSVL